MDKYTAVEKKYHRKQPLAKFEVGDTVDVQVAIKEGDKERIQIFNGTVIAKRGGGLAESFVVRRIVQDEGVERVFPVNSPKIAGIEVKRQGRVRRAKLNFLRERTGKSTRLTERKESGGRGAEATSKEGGAPKAASKPAAAKKAQPKK
jgi:large subunit ribosomal protein L19